MLIVTSENVSGYRLQKTIGQVFGVTVRSRGAAGNLMASFRTILGGEINEYTKMVEDSRAVALERLSVNAKAMGANAVIMMRFDSSEIDGKQPMSEIVAYGTAVFLVPDATEHAR